MKRKFYEFYDYLDPDNLYIYRHSSVLRNKQEERDEQKAHELEYRMVASQSLKLFINPIEVHSVENILKINKFLFQGMYHWAGEFRKVNISKSGNAFMQIQASDTALTYLNNLIDGFHNNTNSRKEVIESLVEILDNLNYFHPFREGNG